MLLRCLHDPRLRPLQPLVNPIPCLTEGKRLNEDAAIRRKANEPGENGPAQTNRLRTGKLCSPPSASLLVPGAVNIFSVKQQVHVRQNHL